MNYKIKIDNPCEQNWEEMTSTEGGKYCLHCSKSVIDFTNLSDKEIITLISKSSGKICGRLTNDQLNRSILLPPKVPATSVYYKIAASFLLIGVSGNSHASAKTIPTEIVSNIEGAQNLNLQNSI